MFSHRTRKKCRRARAEKETEPFRGLAPRAVAQGSQRRGTSHHRSAESACTTLASGSHLDRELTSKGKSPPWGVGHRGASPSTAASYFHTGGDASR